MMRIWTIGTALLLSACASTNPQSGAGISYALPRTDAKLAITLTLRSCDAKKGIEADADLALVPIAGAQSERYFIAGEMLASSRIKRSLSLAVNDKGVITGINSENEDQSPQILENILKTATTVVGMAGPLWVDGGTTVPDDMLVCRPEVRAALVRSDWLEEKIAELRLALIDPKTRDDPTLVKRINRYANEKASLDTGILLIEATAPLKINDNYVGDARTIIDSDWQNQHEVALDAPPFEKWFGKPAQTDRTDENTKTPREQMIDQKFGLRWAVSKEMEPAWTPQPTPGSAKSLRPCGFAIAVPAPGRVNVAVHGTGEALPPGTETDKLLYAAQDNKPKSLCLDVGFGESRSVALTFDEFGRTTEFGWSSNATAVSGTAAIAGIASTADSLRSTLEGPSTIEVQKAEIEKLETQQRYNEVKKCEAIIKAGGFNCDPPTEE